MSQGRVKQSPWREILSEVEAQRTLLESLLHPEQTSAEAHINNFSPAPLPPPTRVAVAENGERERRSAGRNAGSQHALLSPSLEATDCEDDAAGPRVARLPKANNAEQKETVASCPSATAVDGSSKVVEALVEALSTSSWSSESRAASPFPFDDGAVANCSQKAVGGNAFSWVPSAVETDTSATVAVQAKALHAAPFYLRATQIVAGEFEERQHIMFDEFTTVTELVSLFVCHMSQSPPKR